MVRLEIDPYFMKIAIAAAQRATCPRKSVGAAITRDRTILSTGYNGAPKGMKHCTEVGCMMEHDHCVRVTHAEMNAIGQAAMNGTAIKGATLYTTASPCWPCFKLIANVGIVRIVFGELYRDPRIKDFAEEARIELVDMSSISMDEEKSKKKCLWCDELVTKDGVPMLCIDGGISVQRLQHQECALRRVFGSVGHQLARCSCFGGTEEDPEGMTKRESALAAVDMYKRRRPHEESR